MTHEITSRRPQPALHGGTYVYTQQTRPSPTPRAEPRHCCTHGFEVPGATLLSLVAAVEHHLLEVVAHPLRELLHAEGLGPVRREVGPLLEEGQHLGLRELGLGDVQVHQLVVFGRLAVHCPGGHVRRHQLAAGTSEGQTEQKETWPLLERGAILEAVSEAILEAILETILDLGATG